MADDPRYPKLYPGERTAQEPSLAGEPPRDAVGTLLRRTREDFGQDLREVSESLRIRYAYLDAIERSAFGELPGPTYAIGFVRGYAQYLGLDDEEIVRRFKEESQGLKRDQELHFPAPVNEGKLPGATILVVSLLLIAGAYGAWTYLSGDERSVADLVPEVPQRLQELVGAEDEPELPSAPNLAARDEGGGEAVADTGERVTDTGTAPADSGTRTAPRDTASGTDAGTDTTGEATGGDDTGPAGTAASGGGQQGTDTDTVASVPDAPAIPEAPSASASGATGSGAPAVPGTGESDGPTSRTETAEAPAASDAESTDASAGAPDGEAGAATPGGGTTSAPANPDQRAALDARADAAGGSASGSGSDAGAAPPAVPEMRQDDSGIPTAPEQTQSAARDAAQGRSFGASADSSRVSLRATARSWVQVRGPDDSLLMTRMLRAGDVYRVPDRPGLLLHTGNAGGLQIVVDGTNLGTLGADGEVRRGIVLEPDALR